METKSWSEKVGELQAVGMTYAEIAEATGSRLSTIGSLATGKAKSPRGDLALRLHTLYLQRAKSTKQKVA
jgi:transcriptional regulator with XRE-family HTH domain